MEGLAKAKEGSLGAGDPRKMKSFLEDSGLQVWLDLEKTGKVCNIPPHNSCINDILRKYNLF